MDAANRLLQQELSTAINEKKQQPALLICDEAFNCAVVAALPLTELTLLSARKDIADELLKLGANTVFSDYHLEASAGSFQLCALRVGKEKLCVHRALNLCLGHLRPGGELLLIGRKDDGIKAYVDKCKKQLGMTGKIKKHGELYCATLEPGPDTLASSTEQRKHTHEHQHQHHKHAQLDDGPYETFRAVAELELGGKRYQIESKPGVFGWKKLDAGSLFLIDQLDIAGLSQLAQNGASALDLGCGSGLLSFAADALGFKNIVASDNNAAAISACQHNFQLNKINATCIADDAGKNLNQQFDFIICNPPFHKGKAHSQELSASFARAIADRLKQKGQAWLVCNAFVGIEKQFKQLNMSSSTVANNKSFKVLKVTHNT
ncbi:class I SAM-dependent methyltransferase [Agaribacterium haliotis]|uniref:class I SAM-dependent methyltransferase n=1 Tax=Agaribacterium haliotis TaxID=2013869 RepID=UPI000BB53B5D|nr:methyltransferase [Agaribacterium haliotis]